MRVNERDLRYMKVYMRVNEYDLRYIKVYEG